MMRQIPILRLFQRLGVAAAAICVLCSAAPSAAQSPCIKGDLTCDLETCGLGDIAQAIEEALDRVEPLHCEADVTCDDEVDLVDVLCLIDCYFDEPSCLDTPCVGGIDPQACDHDCRELLFDSPPNVVPADDCFRAQPTEDDEAHFFRAITGLLRVAEEQKDGDDPSTFTDSWKEMLDRLDVPDEGRSIFDFTAEIPDDLPDDSPDGGDVQDFLQDVLIAGIDDAIEQLLMIDSSFTTTITADELEAVGVFDTDSIEVDYGDVKGLEAGLHTWKFGVLTLLLGWDLDVDIDALQFEEIVRIQQDLLGPHPDLLKMVNNGNNLRGAGDALDAAIDAYYAGSHFIRNEVDSQDDDLLTIDPEDLTEEEYTRMALGEVQCSLQGRPLDSITETAAVCGSGAPSIDGEHIDASNFFGNPFSLRSMLPSFTYDSYCGTDTVEVPYPPQSNAPFPDPTFNGTAPDLTQEMVAEAVTPTLEVWGWFGPFSPGQTRWFYMENDGDSLAEKVLVETIGLETGTAFSLSLPDVTLPRTLCSGEGFLIEVTFDPPGPGQFSDTLEVQTDNPYVNLSFTEDPVEFQGDNILAPATDDSSRPEDRGAGNRQRD